MSNALAEKGPTRTVEFDSNTVAGGEMLSEIIAYAEAKQAVKEAKAKQDAHEARIREMMGESNVVKVDGAVRASIAVRNRSNLDKTMIPEAIIAAATTNTTYTVLDAK